MNPSRIRLFAAVAAIFAGTAPSAYAEDAVSLYGRLYVTVESVEAPGGSTPIARRTRVADEFSNLGVRGRESLGGDLKAFFQLETAFKADQNDTGFATRNSGVGLEGAWGRFILGRWDTPFEDVTSTVDAFGDLTNGGIAAALNGSGVANQQGTFDRRDTNVVQYWSPKWGGLSMIASYSANEARTANRCVGAASGSCNPWTAGAALSWSNERFFVAYAYDRMNDTAFGPVTPHSQSGNAIMGTMVAGPIKVGAIYEEFRRDGFSKQTAWLGNAIWRLGPHRFIYQYQQARDGGATALQPRCHVNTLAYQYHFSVRTFAMLQFTDVDNNATATCNFGHNTLAIAPGQDPRAATLGMRHLF